MNATSFTERSARHCEEAIWLLPITLMSIGLFALAQAAALFFDISPLSMLAHYGVKALHSLPPILAMTILYMAFLAIRESPQAPITAFLLRATTILNERWIIAARIAPLLLMPVVFVSFSSLKMLIPQFVPFWLDDTFAAMDRVLFFGHQPWEVTHAVFGSIPATIFIDRAYSMWVLLLSVSIVLFALFAPRPDRARFFMAFTLAWVLLGFGGAWLLVSAGPCYSASIGAESAPQFAGLVSRLGEISDATGGGINAWNWQKILWRSHSTQSYSFGMGISAMPSLHNAIAALYVLSAFRIGRMLGWFMTAYAAVIFIGSVHLGWHYAVDGIVGVAAMVLIWRWVDHWCRQSGYDAAVSSAAKEPGQVHVAVFSADDEQRVH